MDFEEASILIVGSLEFGKVVEKVLKATLSEHSFIRCVAWETATPIWSSRLFRETDLFIIEMYREYPTGFRPEGLITASQIGKRGAKPLVVGPFLPSAIDDSTSSSSVWKDCNWFWSVDEGSALSTKAMLVLDTEFLNSDLISLNNAADKAAQDDATFFQFHR